MSRLVNPTATIFHDDGSEETVTLPFRWEICGCCEGSGTSSAYLGAFTAEDLREDPDFAEEYFAGRYDRACESCHGSGKVTVVDRKRCNPEHLKAWDEDRDADREWRAEARNEARRLGDWT